MYLIDREGNKVEAEIKKVQVADYRRLKKDSEFEFDWLKYRGKEAYKLCQKGNVDILGLIHVTDYPDVGFDFLMIEQIEIQKRQRGPGKELDRIGGCWRLPRVFLLTMGTRDIFL